MQIDKLLIYSTSTAPISQDKKIYKWDAEKILLFRTTYIIIQQQQGTHPF